MNTNCSRRFLKTIMALSILVAMMDQIVEAKDTYCRNRFSNKEDWIYCTKFGTATSARVRVRLRAKFLARHS